MGCRDAHRTQPFCTKEPEETLPNRRSRPTITSGSIETTSVGSRQQANVDGGVQPEQGRDAFQY